MALTEKHRSPAAARASLQRRGWTCLRIEPRLRFESWELGSNRAALLWYASELDGADVVFVHDPAPRPPRAVERPKPKRRKKRR
jgi:hypothetical protein